MATKRTPKRGRKVALPRWATGVCPANTRMAVIRRDGRCIYCGATGDLTIDHFIPQSVAIDHRPSNLVTACMNCNRLRSAIDCDLFCRHVARRTHEPWRKIYARVLAALATPVEE